MGSTLWKVMKESSTGSTSSSKIRLNLTIEVERAQFDPDTCVLRLSGKNQEESDHVKVRYEMEFHQWAWPCLDGVGVSGCSCYGAIRWGPTTL